MIGKFGGILFGTYDMCLVSPTGLDACRLVVLRKEAPRAATPLVSRGRFQAQARVGFDRDRGRAPECLCEIVPSRATNDARGCNDCLAKSWRRE
jgi:hypothetical protein